MNLTVLSLGAGVQSTTLLLMALKGEFDKTPDVAIFSDTGWEPPHVYEHLDWLEREVNGRIPILRVGRSKSIKDEVLIHLEWADRFKLIEGDIDACKTVLANHPEMPTDERAAFETTLAKAEQDMVAHMEARERIAQPPFWIKNGDGSQGVLRRMCTKEYKIEPIKAKMRELVGAVPGRPVPKGVKVEQWFGISLDEVHRMKMSDQKWIKFRYPLVDNGIDRNSCLLWMERNGYPRPPKSACVGCPYRNNASWRDMKDNRPEEWAEAVAWDEAIRHRMKGVDGEAYLHREMVPLPLVDLRTTREKGQLNIFDDEFGEECEGMCGV